MKLNVITSRVKSMLCVMEAQPTLMEEIHASQAMDPQLERIREEVLFEKAPGFVIHEDSILRFHN